MPPKKKSLAEQLADLSTAAPVDFDPEDMGGDSFTANADAGSDVESQDSGDDAAGREHYVSMGKSQLRTKQFLLDDPKYKGKKISRKAALNIESDEESEEEESDAEDDDDEDLMGGLHGDDDEEGEEDEEEGEDSDEDDAEEDDDEDDDDEDEEDGYGSFSANGMASASNEMQEELQKIQEEEKALLQRMTKSVNEDVEKGMHVKSQLSIWETLLDTRIRLQKSVALTNSFPQPDMYEELLTNDTAEPQEEAKMALRSFIDTLITVRTSLLRNLEGVAVPKTNKRKLADLAEDKETRQKKLDDDSWETKAWKDVEGLNEAWRSYRNNTLEKWSNKVQVASGIPLNKKFKAMNQASTCG
ncbi:rRNA-processing protein bfr2 [Actinomortierella ambigua]|uniref:rRNA-processing protein bfr2 n=1 Tax=Actinomortierella ambigua TaxID=1343610 RepID=A0A9P6U6L7_9FUNG|nr:rRNA-processing protein bfr2 [Actinomortierella ambigua]